MFGFGFGCLSWIVRIVYYEIRSRTLYVFGPENKYVQREPGVLGTSAKADMNRTINEGGQM